MATHIVKAPAIFDTYLQTTVVIKYLEKQHDSVIRNTSGALVFLVKKKKINSFHHKKDQQDDVRKLLTADTTARKQRCIDLMSLDLVLRLSEMLRSTASLLESHIAEMSSTYLSGEE